MKSERRPARIGYTILVVLGSAILLRLLRAELSAGVLLLCIGGIGLAREARMVWLAAQAERTQRLRQEARSALEAARRERAQRQRLERQQRRHTRERAQAAQVAAQRSQQEQRVAAQQRQEQGRAARQLRMEAAAERWLAMSPDRLPEAIERLFAQRGFNTERLPGDALCDLLLEEPDGRQTLARCLGRGGTAADVQDLDAWRRLAERSHAYLIALDGFTPQAVRLIRNLPITLVEAHLLATWEEKSESTDFTDSTD
jgi:flagellar biosynthesis GTPase FlhF